MSLISDFVFPEQTKSCWKRGEIEWVVRGSTGPGWGAVRSGGGSGSKCDPPPADPHSQAGQQGGVVASGSLGTVDEAVSTSVPSFVLSLSCCDVPVKWCPPASRLENTQRQAFTPHLCLEQLKGDSSLPPGFSAHRPLPHFSQPAGQLEEFITPWNKCNK